MAKEALQWRRGNITQVSLSTARFMLFKIQCVLFCNYQDDLIWRHKGKIHLSNSIEQTVDAIEKLQMLDMEWTSILQELVHKTLSDYSDMHGYTKRYIEDLEKN